MSTTLFLILDGFGLNDTEEGNAVKLGKTPFIDELMENCPFVQVAASGLNVGLPKGQMGNSEVGHLNIGAGRVVYQELTRISKAVEEGTILENAVLRGAMEKARDNGKALHFMGLLSDGGVHSHNTHLYGFIEMAKELGLKEVYVHAFMDGRDVPPDSGKEFINQLQAKLDKIGLGKIATISGRYYAMDRDNRWERVEIAYNALCKAEGKTSEDALTVMQNSYDEGIFDEFVVPTVITQNGTPVAKIQQDDSVIFFNFRPDRAREITRAIVDRDFTGFERTLIPVTFVALTQYDVTITEKEVAFTPETLENTLGEYLAKMGKTQLRIAETEKYAHVTFFFNGGVEKENNNEDRILIPSPKVATYDLQPEMSVYEVSDRLVEQIKSQKYDIIIANFANADMVGHTGNMDAAMAAIKAVDESVEKVVKAVESIGGCALITADHGNADQMIDPETGGAFTAHTTNPVPLILVNFKAKGLREGGKLADLAPTLLDIMDLEQPPEMDGKSLLIR
ncbi:MAG: phosphoglycerate mutase (2,3-diphosphoglycerate-independent) [Candidatus Epulonipiscioides saccharophilum]|nr:MAG: phosphoglycerate mutase (2,3-diphosphoglycerate-independent) [Epulopiscium sp. AS2M-Bin001]